MPITRSALLVAASVAFAPLAGCGQPLTSASGLNVSGVCELRCWACSGTDLWGAVAYSKSTNACGFSYEFDEEADAESAAVGNCGADDCALVSPQGELGFTNTCVALATETPFRQHGAYATGSAGGSEAAQKAAVSACEVARPAVFR